MIFKKKGDNNLKSFWVEDYNQTEKKFFLKLGFTETTHGENTKKFGIKDYLSFRGSGMFGFWTDEEKIRIYNTVMLRFKMKKIRIEIAYEE